MVYRLGAPMWALICLCLLPVLLMPVAVQSASNLRRSTGELDLFLRDNKPVDVTQTMHYVPVLNKHNWRFVLTDDSDSEDASDTMSQQYDEDWRVSPVEEKIARFPSDTDSLREIQMYSSPTDKMDEEVAMLLREMNIYATAAGVSHSSDDAKQRYAPMERHDSLGAPSKRRKMDEASSCYIGGHPISAPLQREHSVDFPISPSSHMSSTRSSMSSGSGRPPACDDPRTHPQPPSPMQASRGMKRERSSRRHFYEEVAPPVVALPSPRMMAAAVMQPRMVLAQRILSATLAKDAVVPIRPMPRFSHNATLLRQGFIGEQEFMTFIELMAFKFDPEPTMQDNLFYLFQTYLPNIRRSEVPAFLLIARIFLSRMDPVQMHRVYTAMTTEEMWMDIEKNAHRLQGLYDSIGYLSTEALRYLCLAHALLILSCEAISDGSCMPSYLRRGRLRAARPAIAAAHRHLAKSMDYLITVTDREYEREVRLYNKGALSNHVVTAWA